MTTSKNLVDNEGELSGNLRCPLFTSGNTADVVNSRSLDTDSVKSFPVSLLKYGGGKEDVRCKVVICSELEGCVAVKFTRL